MDKRLELTKEQKELAKKFNELCEEMNRADIGFIHNGEGLLLINLNHVEKWVPTDEMIFDVENNILNYDEEFVDFDEFPWCDIELFYTATLCEDNIAIRYKV